MDRDLKQRLLGDLLIFTLSRYVGNMQSWTFSHFIFSSLELITLYEMKISIQATAIASLHCIDRQFMNIN